MKQSLKNKWFLGSLLSVSLLLGSAHMAKAQISETNKSETNKSEADAGAFRRINQPLSLKVGVAAAGAGLISLELWWFLFSKTKAQTAKTAEGIQSINIMVDGGYSPNQIRVQAGQPVQLNFLRKDPSSCLEQIILPDFNKAIDLPLNETATVEVLPKQPGDYAFHCGMNMFRGTMTAEDSSQQA